MQGAVAVYPVAINPVAINQVAIKQVAEVVRLWMQRLLLIHPNSNESGYLLLIQILTNLAIQ